jgi:hypothetical protein
MECSEAESVWRREVASKVDSKRWLIVSSALRWKYSLCKKKQIFLQVNNEQRGR